MIIGAQIFDTSSAGCFARRIFTNHLDANRVLAGFFSLLCIGGNRLLVDRSLFATLVAAAAVSWD